MLISICLLYTSCHCIANSDVYWERMERRESYLLFLRKTAEPDTPYYTVEAEPGGTVPVSYTHL